MELASRIRWLLVIFVVVVFLVLIGWGLFSIASNIFDTFSGDGAVTQVNDYNVSSTATARLIVDGPVVAASEHRSYEIAVSENVVSMTVYSGYGRNAIAEESYRNTDDAFTVFLSALEYEGVTDRQRNTTEEMDFEEEGVCPRGRRYIVELDSSIRRWSTSCRDGDGTAGFAMRDIRRLFEDQIPDFRDLVRGTGL